MNRPKNQNVFSTFSQRYNAFVSPFKPFCYRNLRFSYPFINLKWWNHRLSFHVPEAWKSCPFRAEPPRIGNYREYLSFPAVLKQNILPLLVAWTKKKNKRWLWRLGRAPHLRLTSPFCTSLCFVEPSGKGVPKFRYKTTTTTATATATAREPSKTQYPFYEQNNSFASASRFFVHVLPSLYN